MQGSWAQKSIFRQILVEACIRSGTQTHLALAREILQQNMVDRKIETPTPANQNRSVALALWCGLAKPI